MTVADTPAILPSQITGDPMRHHKHIPLFLLAILAFACTAQAGSQSLPPQQIKLNELTRDTQKQVYGDGGKEFEIVWWMPREYWEASLSQQQALDPSIRKTIIDTLGDYDVVAVVEGSMADDMQFRFVTENEIRDATHLLDTKGNALDPLRENDVPPKVASLLASLKPVLSSNMGPVGKSMHFMVFPGNDKQGSRRVDPSGNGRMQVKTRSNTYVFRLPLGSLLPNKVDAATGDLFPGDYLYSPYSGATLETAKQP